MYDLIVYDFYRKSISLFDTMNDVLRHMHLGFIRLHILYHACKGPICGVELMEELRQHGYDVGPGTIYPMIHQMEAAGILKAQEEIVGGKRRKNLKATAAGRKLLNQAREKLVELAGEVLNDEDPRNKRR